MATSTQSHNYDHPAYIVPRLVGLGRSLATNGIVAAAMYAPYNMRLARMYATVLVAGTSDTNTFTIRENTTSIGVFSLDSSAALFDASVDLDVTLTSGNTLNLLKGTDATGQAAFWVEVFPIVGQSLPI